MTSEHKHKWDVQAVYMFLDPDDKEKCVVLYSCYDENCDATTSCIGDLY